jgi:hypothetical protein
MKPLDFIDKKIFKTPKFDEDGESFNKDIEMEMKMAILGLLLLLIINVNVILVTLILE